MRVEDLVRIVPDPVETLLPQSDKFGCRFKELMCVVSSFGFAFPRLGPSAQWFFNFSRGFYCLTDHLNEVLLRLDDEDT